MDVQEMWSCLEKEIGNCGVLIVKYKIITVASDSLRDAEWEVANKVNDEIELG